MLQKRCVLEHVCQELGFDLPLKQEGKKVLVNVEENTEEIRKALVQFFDLEGTSDEAAAAGSNGRFFVALAAESQEGLQQGARKEGGDAVPAGGSSETWLTFMLWVSLLLELGCRSSRFAKRVGAKALSALPSVLGCGAEARHQWLGVSADDPLAKRRRGSI